LPNGDIAMRPATDAIDPTEHDVVREVNLTNRQGVDYAFDAGHPDLVATGVRDMRRGDRLWARR
jgi:NADPH:quinone reductase-like Zn-dependent oxidoreductase